MKDPSFWHERDLRSRRAAPITRILLTPFALFYQWAGSRRIRQTEPVSINIPVICVGNLTVGGSGKTPVVAAIREHFRQKGVRAASLSRGYKGELKGPLRVGFQIHTARLVGDEPLMLSRQGEAWIGADREATARAMQDDGVELIIMDDGHQNPTLHKDVSIVVIDGGNPYGNGFVFPKGPLREPVQSGLLRADAVVIMGDLAHDIPELAGFSGPVIKSRVMAVETAPDGPLIAFAGIGRPQKFFDTLQASGGALADAVPFPDHHTFSPSDISYLRNLAADREARLITTEKDYVRLSENDREGVLVFPVSASLTASDIDVLTGPVLKLLS